MCSSFLKFTYELGYVYDMFFFLPWMQYTLFKSISSKVQLGGS